MRKTQLGPGSHHGESTWGAAVKWGVRPACRSTTGRRGESDAASLRRPHRRPARGEAATQPRDGCAADVKNRAGRREHSDQRGVREPSTECASPRVSRFPNWHRRSSARLLDRLTQREGAYPSWNAVGRAGLDPSGRSGSGMDPPGFSARNAVKSQKLSQLSPEQPSEWKASDGEISPLRTNCTL